MDVIGPLIAGGFFALWLVLVVPTVKKNKKIKAEILAKGYRTKAKVIDYENRYVRVGGTNTYLDYPVVIYKNQEGEEERGYLKYASSSGRPFSIGAVVSVVIYKDTIYYQRTLEMSGLDRFKEMWL